MEKALSWGKGIVSEQIVVDTGSSDRTIALAEKMGARVFQFDWIDDFAAAKNYAIARASGDWIAFLDADEYLLEKDALKLPDVLGRMEKAEKAETVCSPWLQLDDKGAVFSTSVQTRIFRNASCIRYRNRIHEELYHTGEQRSLHGVWVREVPVYHTGYADTVYEQTGKLERNIRLIRRELEDKPERMEFWSYLGDALLLENRDEEAGNAYRKVAAGPLSKIRPDFKLHAISSLIRMAAYGAGTEGEKEVRWLYEEFTRMHTPEPDINFWTGVYMVSHAHAAGGRKLLEKAVGELEDYRGNGLIYLASHQEECYAILMDACREMGDFPSAVKYGVLSLRAKKYQDTVPSRLMWIFAHAGENAENVAGFFGKLYDLGCLKDKLFLIREAGQSGFGELERGFRDMLTREEREWLDRKKDSGPEQV